MCEEPQGFHGLQGKYKINYDEILLPPEGFPMAALIRTQTLPAYNSALFKKGTYSLPLLPGEIKGAAAFYGAIDNTKRHEFKSPKDRIQVHFYLTGQGQVSIKNAIYAIREMSLFIAPMNEAYCLQAFDAPLEYLEIQWEMRKDDEKDLETAKIFLPYFIAYSACKTYREAIKSPKTVNRTIVPENVIPRFCMGSVETEGPDSVGAHKHPMLEQHFFGLKGNDCVVKADGAEARLGERVLLHIPLGSEHGVRVDAGKKLHYLWLDFFQDKKGVEWITQMHKPVTPEG
jgi:mannose-6-phosphate isomerase-like protein (cupin superfamily)